LVHLVGDLHQPLHISKKHTKGYVNCMVKFVSPNRVISLHQVWDSGLIDAEKLSYSEWWSYLSEQSFNKDLSLNPKQWAVAAYEQHGAIVPKEPDRYCKEYSKQRISRSDMPYLSWPYRAKVLQVMNQQLWLGGVRLAHVLNEVADD